ncbi:peptide chain release factor 1 [bacterium]|nr:peptide chain release factor 1 [bacterium]MCB1220457.1 peptide chain release factor 1 [bacterium]UNM08131.1 MAG: peptide chain release factor 1 [Planctomycetales bacterium]
MWDKLEQVEQRYLELEKEMAEPEVIADHERLAKISRDHSELEEIVLPYREALIVKNNLEQSREELKGENDEELRELLKQDINELEPQLAEMEENLKRLITPKDPNDRKDCIIEVRAGAGGDEAALFAGELMEMYMTFAKGRRWDVSIVDLQETGLKGVKEATVEVKGRDAYGWLKFESGVHRVQRVPATESGGRIHTSTATVAVLPEVEDVDVEVNDSDLKIDTYRASGAGGQHVNKTSSAIRMTHLPTGVVVTCQDQRSQLQNKEKALKVLKSKLYQMEEERKARENAENRKSQIGTGDRSEKIRTYNFPDGRITDHRIGKKVHNLEGFFRGEITEMLEALRTHEEGERLAQL